MTNRDDVEPTIVIGDNNTVTMFPSLRDYFAGQAMQSIFAGPGAHDVANRDRRYNETNWSEVIAINAYEMADAMLEARKK